MPLEEMDSSSEGSGSEGGEDEEVTEQQSREAAFVVRRPHTLVPTLVFVVPCSRVTSVVTGAQIWEHGNSVVVVY